jgi:iron complex outermembrane receptor protein
VCTGIRLRSSATIPSLLVQSCSYLIALLLVPGLWLGQALAQDGKTDHPSGDLTDLTVEQLANLEVVTVARKPEKRSEVTAAAYVISEEEIKASGANSIPEVLRSAPGVHVARVDSNQWAIGIRGFGGSLSRSQLALMDGRSLYTPLFAGVYWDVQDTILEDVERIEVIRGPGGALWGTNAVNGVISIITKNSRDTQGWLFSTGGGNEDQAVTQFRYGGGLGTDLTYRVYGKVSARSPEFHPTGSEFDDQQMGQIGFRGDWREKFNGTFTLQGAAYGGQAGRQSSITSYTQPYRSVVQEDSTLSGTYLLGRWQSTGNGDRQSTLQFYYDRSSRREPTFSENRDTVDIDFQNRFGWRRRHQLSWGTGYRISSGDDRGSASVVFTPQRRNDQLLSAFIQDEITLLPNRLTLTVGSRVGGNSYSGFENQPSIRMLWKVSERQTAWGAVSQALRTPSRVERDLSLVAAISPTTPVFISLTGDQRFVPEKLTAYEVGYRVQAGSKAFFDIASFYDDYNHLSSLELQPTQKKPLPDGTTATIFPFLELNGMEGRSYGAEVSSDYRPLPNWRLSGSYSLLRLNLDPKSWSHDVSTKRSTEGSSPEHMVALQSLLNLPHGFDGDLAFRYVSALPAQRVAAYSTADVRLGWRATRQLELSVIGHDLLQPHHAEFGGGIQVKRGVFGKVTWRH